MTIGAEFDAVLSAAVAGEDWAITVLYRDLQPGLLRYLRARAPEVAEDLAADVWVAAAPQLPSFVGSEDRFRAWMFTIARNKLLEHWRKVGRRRTTPVPAEALAERAGADDPTAAILGRLSAQEAVDALATSLPAAQADIVLLRVLGGLSVAEVAELMGMRPGAVRVAQHRALRRLAATFSREAVTG